jgi:hypothetical protein
MTQIQLSDDSVAQLASVTGPVEVCNSQGQTVGYFTPKADASLYANLDLDITDEELDRSEAEPGGRTWAEIRADLKRLK